MVLISPSILAANFKRLKSEIVKIEKAGADWLHIDVMDGEFVPGKTVFIDSLVVKKIKQYASLPLDIHLMVQEPQRYIKDFIKAGVDYISMHIESKGDLPEAIKLIKNHKIKAGIAISPQTSLSKLKKYIKLVDFVLIMSVVPGQCGQLYIKSATKRIQELKKYIRDNRLNVLIQVDGGIKENNAYKAINAGADVLVSGSGIFKEKDCQKIISKMREVLLIGSDHGGYGLKKVIISEMNKIGIAYQDIGCYSKISCDYPDFAKRIAKNISEGKVKKGILICGTGIGMAIAANRYKNVRAALCHNEFTAEMSARHNKANILVLGGRTTRPAKAKEILKIWLSSEFGKGRHNRRIKKIEQV